MGKIKGKIVKQGDSGCLQVKQADGSWVQYDYNQPLSAQLGIVENGVVTCTLIPYGTSQLAVSVAPVDRGDIVEIDYVNGTGKIYENESNITYVFYQNYLKESGFMKGDTVKYTIAQSKDGICATCLVKPVL